MNKQQQNSVMLFLASFSAIVAGQVIQSNGSSVMDFSQGVLTGIGIVGMMMTIVTLGRFNKRREQ
ncbi:hypothetical protein HQN87_25895 [Paenibacillus tritici]|jgi:hypothetical protein|uniref:Uncharacterized protein n=1 Tax=Paenibacillus tritici TaxID=1873425 RepID=A0ABX2DVM6_9BACL|nr:hypothetical protein [Paenibacillus tritici]NQX48758.1 hypothetical protein [Paenibacillus tritici]QUL55508.1 hypothetical protein KDC22_02710 [Paenibacillus tritici]